MVELASKHIENILQEAIEVIEAILLTNINRIIGKASIVVAPIVQAHRKIDESLIVKREFRFILFQ